MEGPTTTASVLASARPDRSMLWAVRLGSTAIVALGIVLLVLAVTAENSPPVPIGFLIVLPLIVFGATFSRANVTEARVTAAGLDLVGVDGVVRSIPGGAIGGVGYAGMVLAGRLVAIPLHWLPNTMGRIVVVDRAGRVICARRAGWMPLDEVEALAAAGGVPWLGSHARTVPGATVPPPPEMTHPHDGPARTEPATAAGLRRQRARVRRVVLATWALPVVSTICFVILANVPDAPARPVLGWVGGLGVVAFILGGPCVALWSSAPREARRILKTDQPWWPVEAVVVAGLISDANARVVGVAHPASGEMAWWTVKWGGERGWLQGDDRGWFWFLPATRGKGALLAPPDRSHHAVLEQRLLGKLALAEARRQIDGEAADWQGRQAWAQWASAQQAAGGFGGTGYSGSSSGGSAPRVTM
jgi:hypothetical protein